MKVSIEKFIIDFPGDVRYLNEIIKKEKNILLKNNFHLSSILCILL